MAGSTDPYHVPGLPLLEDLKLNPWGSLKAARPRWAQGLTPWAASGVPR